MDEPAEPESSVQFVKAIAGPGERLRNARLAAGMTLAQVGVATRIPQRHLQVIEADNFLALPARTYAIGFSKSYARAVGLDEDAIADEVRAIFAEHDEVPASRPATFEPGDPARVPGSNIIWIATGAVLVLLVIGYFAYNSMFAPTAELPSLLDEEQAQAAQAQAPEPAPIPAMPDESAAALPIGGAAAAVAPVTQPQAPAASPAASPSPTASARAVATPKSSPKPTAKPSPTATPSPRATQARRADPTPTPKPSPRATATRASQRSQGPAPGPVEAAIAAAGGGSAD